MNVWGISLAVNDQKENVVNLLFSTLHHIMVESPIFLSTVRLRFRRYFPRAELRIVHRGPFPTCGRLKLPRHMTLLKTLQAIDNVVEILGIDPARLIKPVWQYSS